MPAKSATLFLGSVFVLLVAIAPKQAAAVTRVAVTNTDQCPSDTVDFPCYTSLTDAINAALSGDAIEIQPGTYTGNFTISQNITSIYGNEAATTFISGGGSGTALTISVSGSISIQKLSFVNAQTGILAQNSPSVTINNDIFDVGPSNTAIQLSSSPNALVYNNAFYNIAYGIVSNQTEQNIKNNIFSTVNNTAVPANADITLILNNLFFNCSSIGPTTISFDPSDTVNYKGNLENEDPLFVNVALGDFHLQAGSPCINTGNTSVGLNSVDNTTADMGAYGGPNADTIPFRVQDVSAVTSGTSIDLSWAANNAYTVAGYRVYYGSSSGVYNGTGATEGSSPITVPTGIAATTFTLSGLSSAVTPSTPTLLSTAPVNDGLVLTWTAASGATGYNVYYGLTSTPTASVSVGPVTSYTLSGLVNDQTYYVYVTAVSQAIYYIAVTAIDDAGSASYSPGVAHESDYSSEVTGGSGAVMESPLSNGLHDFPEALVPYPDLPNTSQGCFIATAAYGFYSVPQVQALRNFRDQFLMTNKPGNAFVGWYYAHGPAAAAWLNEHPQYKPLVRAALLPAIIIALFMTQTSGTLKIVLIAFMLCIVIYTFYRRRLSRSGGLR
ncbi:MAG TPA: CFI-box-CTERM domain-containing protein [Nitrospirota bacterium]|nr:CFI-box-CTERM domain-containing protein [Nitrospirota bacterium]